MVDEPTEEDRLEFVRSYGVEPVTDVNTDLTLKDAALSVAEMTPIIGDAMAAKEVYDELMKEDPNYKLIAALGGAALIGAIPGIGDAAAAGIRKAADTLKRVEIDPDALGMMGGNIRLKPKPKEEDYLTLDNPNYKELRGQVDETTDINAAEGLLDSTEEDIAKIREAQAANRKQDEAGKRPFAEEAQALERNEITSKEFREKAFADVEKFTELEQLPTFTEIVFALDKNKREKGIIGLEKSMAQGAKKIAAGDRVMARLDIPAYNRFDVYVPQITFRKEGAKGAESVFSRTMVIEDVKFPTPQKPSFDIARGEKTKYPHATINGQVASNPASKKMYTDQEAHDLAKSVFDDPDFVHVGYNPDRGGFFYDRETNMPVFDSPLVVQIGKQIFAKRSGETSAERVAKMREMDLRKTSPDIKKPTLFSEGGMALEEQMSMNFGDVPDNTIGQDPVSGNDIPLGSTAENVRDDIPANLSEGEIVVPADVVNFHGVKLFEDLRKEAKMGYAQMAEDGRIGGEPMDMNDDMDIELSELDLEIMDDEAPVEMRRGGMSMKDYEGVTKNRDIKPPKRSGPRKTHAEIMASAFRDDDDNKSSSSSSKPSDYYSPENISKRVQARKNKPKTRGEALYRSMKDLFSGGDDDDKPTRNKYNLDLQFGGNLAERGARKFGTAAPSAGQVQGAYTGQQEPFNTDFERQPFFQALVKNLKKELGMDEGGLVPDEDQHLIGGESQFNQGPYYAPDQKGGFDMENAYANYGQGEGPVIEMREYMNDEGHRIFITFIDGEPQMEIPAGYYPVGDDVVVAPEVPPVGGSGGSDDGGSGMDMPTATPVNYKELSIEELQQMVEDHKSFGSKVFASLSPFTRLAMWDQTRRTKAEIERRLADPNISNVDRMRLEQLLDIANRDEPGLIKTLVDKITGNTLQTAAGQIPKPKMPDVDFDDPTEAGTVAAPYTPNDQEEDGVTTPGINAADAVDLGYTPAEIIQKSIEDKRFTDAMEEAKTRDTDDDEPFVQGPYDNVPPVDSGFGGMGTDPAEEFGGSRVTFQDPPSLPPAPSYTKPANDPYSEKRGRRSGGGGRNKGGLAKKKTKKSK
jgi:hypothetical protein